MGLKGERFSGSGSYWEETTVKERDVLYKKMEWKKSLDVAQFLERLKMNIRRYKLLGITEVWELKDIYPKEMLLGLKAHQRSVKRTFEKQSEKKHVWIKLLNTL